MKRTLCIALFTSMVSICASADIQYCLGNSACQYLVNTGFGTTGDWVYTGSSARTSVTDPCGLGTTWAGVLGNGYSIYQEFYGEPQTGSPLQWKFNFDVYFDSSGGTIYDQLKITVKDLTTNVSEVFFLDATQYGTCGSRVTFYLNNDYQGHNVRITFTKGGLAVLSIAVDNVAFWSTPI